MVLQPVAPAKPGGLAKCAAFADGLVALWETSDHTGACLWRTLVYNREGVFIGVRAEIDGKGKNTWRNKRRREKSHGEYAIFARRNSRKIR